MGPTLFQRIRNSSKDGGGRKLSSPHTSSGESGRRSSKTNYKGPFSALVCSGSHSQVVYENNGSVRTPLTVLVEGDDENNELTAPDGENNKGNTNKDKNEDDQLISIAVRSLNSKDEMSSLQFGESVTSPAQLRFEQLGGGQGRIVMTPVRNGSCGGRKVIDGGRKEALENGGPNCVGSLELDDSMGRRMENLHSRRLQPPSPVDPYVGTDKKEEGNNDGIIGGIGGGLARSTQCGGGIEGSFSSRRSNINANSSLERSRQSEGSRRSESSRQSESTMEARASRNRSGGPVDLDDSILTSDLSIGSFLSADTNVEDTMEVDDSVTSSYFNGVVNKFESSACDAEEAIAKSLSKYGGVEAHNVRGKGLGNANDKKERISKGGSERLCGGENTYNSIDADASLTSSFLSRAVNKFENTVSNAELAISKSLVRDKGEDENREVVEPSGNDRTINELDMKNDDSSFSDSVTSFAVESLIVAAEAKEVLSSTLQEEEGFELQGMFFSMF
eukprot:CAMPEP_0197440056 /NCGR_PEP_ID=MMETSP1175-20131217/6649_1 /TAXON_ID=1003142 /ORGANISM="Triceratium dubium, Strain CCMP147" /LENGTH=503 /DNA_ID=CAMNT_0042970087 /DNA_START=438 /DNA_END=1949 /DNA_ORIENTATION=+